MSADISVVVADLESYTITGDKSRIIATKDKREHKADEFREKVGKKMRILVNPPTDIAEGTAFAFSTEKQFEEWLAQNKLRNKYDTKVSRKHHRRLTGDEMEAVKQRQQEEVREATEAHERLLKKHNLKPSDTEQIEDLMVSDYDPYRGGRKHSAFLYDEPWYGGEGYILPGDWFFGRSYPDLGWFSDRTASLSTWGSREVHLFEDVNFGGRALWTWHAMHNLSDWWYIFGSFSNDIASSARVF